MMMKLFTITEDKSKRQPAPFPSRQKEEIKMENIKIDLSKIESNEYSEKNVKFFSEMIKNNDGLCYYSCNNTYYDCVYFESDRSLMPVPIFSKVCNIEESEVKKMCKKTTMKNIFHMEDTAEYLDFLKFDTPEQQRIFVKIMSDIENSTYFQDYHLNIFDISKNTLISLLEGFKQNEEYFRTFKDGIGIYDKAYFIESVLEMDGIDLICEDDSEFDEETQNWNRDCSYYYEVTRCNKPKQIKQFIFGKMKKENDIAKSLNEIVYPELSKINWVNKAQHLVSVSPIYFTKHKIIVLGSLNWARIDEDINISSNLELNGGKVCSDEILTETNVKSMNFEEALEKKLIKVLERESFDKLFSLKTELYSSKKEYNTTLKRTIEERHEIKLLKKIQSELKENEIYDLRKQKIIKI